MDLHEMFTEGCIGEFYGKDKFVRIYPLFTIDRVKFSFIQKGTGGVHLDFYMKMYPDFKNLMLDTLGKRRNLWADIKNDTGQYPSARKYVSGDSGQNNLAIGLGQNGNCIIQGRQQEAGNYMIPFAYEEMQEMAYWFFKLSVYHPVPDDKVPYLNQEEKLCQRFWAYYYRNAQTYHPDTVPVGEAFVSKFPEQELGRKNTAAAPETAQEEYSSYNPYSSNEGREYEENTQRSDQQTDLHPQQPAEASEDEKMSVVINGVFSDLRKLQTGEKLTLWTVYGAESFSTRRSTKGLQILNGDGEYIAADRLKVLLREKLQPEEKEQLYRKYKKDKKGDRA